jgi:hypothetical protein
MCTKKSFFKKQQNIFVDMRDVFLRNIRENTNKNNYNFETNDDYFVCPTVNRRTDNTMAKRKRQTTHFTEN